MKQVLDFRMIVNYFKRCTYFGVEEINFEKYQWLYETNYYEGLKNELNSNGRKYYIEVQSDDFVHYFIILIDNKIFIEQEISLSDCLDCLMTKKEAEKLCSQLQNFFEKELKKNKERVLKNEK